MAEPGAQHADGGGATTTERPLLDVRDVTRRFGGLTAVDAVSFSVAEGEALGLIGANGAGKTTLFNCLTGFDTPTSGQVLLDGTDIVGKPRHQVVRAGVARTFQIVRPFPDLPVLANVMVPVAAAGAGDGGAGAGGRRGRSRVPDHPDLRVRAATVLARVGLLERAAVPASRLSEGDLKRLEMARALATEPRLLLLDEPFAGLSQNEIGVLSRTIRALRDEGVTLVVVEHKIGSLLKLVDRVVAMDQGKVIAEGAPQDVVRHPAVVEAYLGGGTVDDHH